MSDEKFYYDINVQIFQSVGGLFYWSVVQEHDEAGVDAEVLAYGEEDSIEDAIENAKAAVASALTLKEA